MSARGLRDALVAPLNRTRGRSPSVLFNGATSASRKPQALRHRTSGLYDASLYGHFATRPDLHWTNEILVCAHPSEKARAQERPRLVLLNSPESIMLLILPIILFCISHYTSPIILSFLPIIFKLFSTENSENTYLQNKNLPLNYPLQMFTARVRLRFAVTFSSRR